MNDDHAIASQTQTQKKKKKKKNERGIDVIACLLSATMFRIREIE